MYGKGRQKKHIDVTTRCYKTYNKKLSLFYRRDIYYKINLSRGNSVHIILKPYLFYFVGNDLFNSVLYYISNKFVNLTSSVLPDCLITPSPANSVQKNPQTRNS